LSKTAERMRHPEPLERRENLEDDIRVFVPVDLNTLADRLIQFPHQYPCLQNRSLGSVLKSVSTGISSDPTVRVRAS